MRRRTKWLFTERQAQRGAFLEHFIHNISARFYRPVSLVTASSSLCQSSSALPVLSALVFEDMVNKVLLQLKTDFLMDAVRHTGETLKAMRHRIFI
jgi:hypothetical protein